MDEYESLNIETDQHNRRYLGEMCVKPKLGARAHSFINGWIQTITLYKDKYAQSYLGEKYVKCKSAVALRYINFLNIK